MLVKAASHHSLVTHITIDITQQGTPEYDLLKRLLLKWAYTC